jgi:putative transposase
MSNNYRLGSHTLFDLRVHLVWVTKYRYPVLNSETLASRVREIIRQVCEANEVNILGGVVSADHVHLYISLPPNISVSKLVMYLKGNSSKKIQKEFADIRKRYWGQHFWARGYFAVSSGNVTDEMIREYIAKHADKDQFKTGDNFEISASGGF